MIALFLEVKATIQKQSAYSSCVQITYASRRACIHAVESFIGSVQVSVNRSYCSFFLNGRGSRRTRKQASFKLYRLHKVERILKKKRITKHPLQSAKRTLRPDRERDQVPKPTPEICSLKNQTSSRASTPPRSTSTKEPDRGRGRSLPRAEEPLQKKKLCATALHPLPPRPARRRVAAHPLRHEVLPLATSAGREIISSRAAPLLPEDEERLIWRRWTASPLPATTDEARKKRGGILRLKSGRIGKETPSPPGTETPLPTKNANNYSKPRLQRPLPLAASIAGGGLRIGRGLSELVLVTVASRETREGKV
jgi:hypothetical protein